MKIIKKLTLINILTAASFSASAAPNDYYAQQTNNNTQNLVNAVVNFGGYLGFDLTKSPSEQESKKKQILLNVDATQVAESFLFYTFLATLPVNTIGQSLPQLFPNSLQNYSQLNSIANYPFKASGYNDPSNQQQGKISVNEQIDQKTYQQDPVSQSILNILGTPDASNCMDYEGKTWNANCSLLFQNKVTTNAIGTLPNTSTYYTYDYNSKFMDQLNSNSLLSPLMYSTDNPGQNTTSSGSPNQQNQGLTSQNQAQQALNFIRYASGSLVPLDLPRYKDYDTLYNQAINSDGATPDIQQKQAQSTLSRYLGNVRTYAAQSSVGLSNLYYILAKRMPMTLPTSGAKSGGQKPVSQAMSEFQMATWRLFNPDMSDSNQWVNQINSGSALTVQKEIATLLAEINYQLYLNRQQEERILLTNSLMLIQNTKATQPTADFFALPNAPSKK